MDSLIGAYIDHVGPICFGFTGIICRSKAYKWRFTELSIEAFFAINTNYQIGQINRLMDDPLKLQSVGYDIHTGGGGRVLGARPFSVNSANGDFLMV